MEATEDSTHLAFRDVDVPPLTTTGGMTTLRSLSDKPHDELEHKLILRDKLAIERTMLSKERTALSYIRTGMSLFLGGMFFVGYFEHGTLFSYVGYATVVVAIIFTLFGFLQNKRSMKVINTVIGELNGKVRED